MFAALSFATPALLLALALVPLIWILLRAAPPEPQRTLFPAAILLQDITPEEETPAKTPWPLLLLRMLAATALIVALAGPILNAPEPSGRTGPLVLIVDDGWTAAADWGVRQDAIAAATDAAARDGRSVIFAGTAPRADAGPAFRVLSGDEARGLAASLQPKPWTPDRAALSDRLDELEALIGDAADADITWASDGLEHGAAAAFAEALTDIAPVTVVTGDTPWAIADASPTPEGLSVALTRAGGDNAVGTVVALAADGRYLGEAPVAFSAGETTTSAVIETPLSVRNEIALLRINGEPSAGATRLLDAGARRPVVGLVSATVSDAQPLLAGLFYVERALQPYADLLRAPLADLVASEATVIILADAGRVTGTDVTALRRWVEDGGTLIRFAGPRLAAAAVDDAAAMLPVRLRGGGRALGGALSWDEPQRLAPFNEGGPFDGLAAPEDVTVSRQVLAEPTVDLADKTWARLEDGTPLVTGAARGDGLIVLFHVTAAPDWSTLPLSGLYVDMLRRAAVLNARSAAARPATPDRALPPVRTLDGFGALQAPPANATALRPAEATEPPSPRRPPGLYGAPGAETAYNAVHPDTELKALPGLQGVATGAYTATPPTSLKPLFLLIAVGLLLIDGLATLALMGKLPRLRARPAAAAFALAAALVATPEETLALDDAFILDAIAETRFAYILTGDARVDEISEAGLSALSFALTRRTALEPAEPVGVEAEAETIAFFPLIYWPVTADARAPSDEAAARINAYLNTGGLIVFDTRDADQAAAGVDTREAQALREILERLDIPPLERLPSDHVLTRTFYLMAELPGRFPGGDVWVEARERPAGGADGLSGGSTNDGVSPVLITGGDWAGAWARDQFGRPLRPVTPGGERQREMAVRAGINVAMYALTGNYKADQVHIPLLLERLGE